MNYKVLVTDEATEDIFHLVKHVYVDLCNPDAADKLYSNLNREVNNMGNFPLKFSDSGLKYRGYIIHKKVYQSYLLFYVIDNEEKKVFAKVIKKLDNEQDIKDFLTDLMTTKEFIDMIKEKINSYK